MTNLLCNFSPKEQDEFHRVARRLLAETFIVKSKDDVSYGDYNFIKRNIDVFNDAFDLFGYVVYLDKISCVAALRISPRAKNIGFINRESFSYNQAVFLAILWQYYFKAKQALNEHVVISKEALDEELKIANKDFKKSEIDEIVKKLKKHNMVNLVGSESITEPGGQMCIYPSIKLALDENECKRVYDEIKMSEETSQIDADEEESEE